MEHRTHTHCTHEYKEKERQNDTISMNDSYYWWHIAKKCFRSNSIMRSTFFILFAQAFRFVFCQFLLIVPYFFRTHGRCLFCYLQLACSWLIQHFVNRLMKFIISSTLSGLRSVTVQKASYTYTVSTRRSILHL